MPTPSPFITPHFKWSEFACHDAACTPVPAELEGNARVVAIECERIRAACMGKKLIVTRGFSTPEHNATIPGAAPHSFHLQALAADLVPPEGLTLDQFVQRIRLVCELISGCRIRYMKIYDDGHVHIDCRPGDRLTVEDARTT